MTWTGSDLRELYSRLVILDKFKEINMWISQSEQRQT
jgi:hypothetical protein